MDARWAGSWRKRHKRGRGSANKDWGSNQSLDSNSGGPSTRGKKGSYTVLEAGQVRWEGWWNIGGARGVQGSAPKTRLSCL